MELEEYLIERKYKPSLIDGSIARARARAIPRLQALKQVAQPSTNRRPVFAVTYDPRLPDLQTRDGRYAP